MGPVVRAVEDVLGGDVHEGEPVPLRRLGQVADGVDVGGADGVEVGRVLGGVDLRPGGGVEDDVDGGPVEGADGRGVGDVEGGAVERDGVRELAAQGPAELAVGPDDDGGHWPCAAYLASTCSFSGPHQASLSRYQSTVAARPSRKSVYCGFQPSSSRSLLASMA